MRGTGVNVSLWGRSPPPAGSLLRTPDRGDSAGFSQEGRLLVTSAAALFLGGLATGAGEVASLVHDVRLPSTRPRRRRRRPRRALFPTPALPVGGMSASCWRAPGNGGSSAAAGNSIRSARRSTGHHALHNQLGRGGARAGVGGAGWATAAAQLTNKWAGRPRLNQPVFTSVNGVIHAPETRWLALRLASDTVSCLPCRSCLMPLCLIWYWCAAQNKIICVSGDIGHLRLLSRDGGEFHRRKHDTGRRKSEKSSKTCSSVFCRQRKLKV